VLILIKNLITSKKANR